MSDDYNYNTAKLKKPLYVQNNRWSFRTTEDTPRQGLERKKWEKLKGRRKTVELEEN